MTYQNLLLEKNEGIAVVTVNREKALNALNPELLKELKDCFDALSEDAEVRAVVITGAGEKAFIAGADIGAMGTMTEAQALEFGKLGHSTMNAIDQCKKPVIAAVNGFCLGGGLELSLSCDFIYASEKAKLGLPEVNLGIFPGWGGTQRLARLVGKNFAREIIFSAKIMSAQEAYDAGIVNRLFKPEELLAAAKATAAEIAKKGPLAVQTAKRIVREGFDLPLAEGLNKELNAFSKCFGTEDQKEGMAAFLGKRPANFKGR
jgi:enoyl-CoA hydratase